MTDLKELWKETDDFVRIHETEIAQKYIHFLREVARHYLSKGKRVFFRENTAVHYGEGGFGWLTLECDDEEHEVLGDNILEIRFKPKVEEKDVTGAIQITEANIEEIKYEVD